VGKVSTFLLAKNVGLIDLLQRYIGFVQDFGGSFVQRLLLVGIGIIGFGFGGHAAVAYIIICISSVVAVVVVLLVLVVVLATLELLGILPGSMMDG
jgi:hypothetical protein